MPRSLFALLLASAVVAAPVPKALKKTPSLEGKWVTVARHVGGSDMTASPWVWDVQGTKLTTMHLQRDGTLTPDFTGDRITLSAPDAARPAELDYLYEAGNQKVLWRGLMKWDGEEFVICFGEQEKDRPTEVKNDRSVYSYYRFKRLADK
jgi:uncharacterized protein (TIGR03067 family)